jgi:hypothetical protein
MSQSEEDRAYEEEQKLADQQYLRQRVNEYYDRRRGQQIAANQRSH